MKDVGALLAKVCVMEQRSPVPYHSTNYFGGSHVQKYVRPHSISFVCFSSHG